jgi:hypothetical protein
MRVRQFPMVDRPIGASWWAALPSGIHQILIRVRPAWLSATCFFERLNSEPDKDRNCSRGDISISPRDLKLRLGSRGPCPGWIPGLSFVKKGAPLELSKEGSCGVFTSVQRDCALFRVPLFRLAEYLTESVPGSIKAGFLVREHRER